MQKIGDPIRSYDQLRKAVASRRRALGLTQEAFNDAAGLAGGYINKIEVGIRKFGDMSLGATLEALGVEIVFQLAAKPTCLRRKINAQPVENSQSVIFSEKKLRLTRQQKGGIKRAEKLSAVRRKEIASMAVKARWKRHFERAARLRKEAKDDDRNEPVSPL